MPNLRSSGNGILKIYAPTNGLRPNWPNSTSKNYSRSTGSAIGFQLVYLDFHRARNGLAREIRIINPRCGNDRDSASFTEQLHVL